MKRFFDFFKAPKRTIQENPEALRKKALHLPFDFDQYYEKIAAFTFNSEIFPLAPETAQAIVDSYQARFNEKYSEFTEHDKTLLQRLERDIARHLTRFKDGTVFVRMSNRSPKDGMPLLAQGETVAQRFSEALVAAPAADTDANAKMVVLSHLQLKLLQCKSAKQVMNLLLTSERVFVDLLLALDCYHAAENDQWSTYVILREWNDQLRGDFEFRVFVCDHKTTAISQYNNYCRFDSLCCMDEAQLATLRQQIIAYVETVKPHIDESSYVIDVALIENKLFVVELNPFQTTTGAALFDWQRDEAILRGKTEDPYPAFRIRRDVMENLREFVDYLLREASTLSSAPYDAYYDDILSRSAAAHP